MFGEKVRNNPPLYRRIGVMSEHETVYDFMTGREFVRMMGEIRKVQLLLVQEGIADAKHEKEEGRPEEAQNSEIPAESAQRENDERHQAQAKRIAEHACRRAANRLTPAAYRSGSRKKGQRPWNGHLES